MTTASTAVEAAWSAAIWNHATIQAITTSILTSDNTQLSEFELSQYRYNQEINAIVYQVTRSESYIGANVLQERFLVEVTYYRGRDESGDNWKAVRDFFDTLLPLVSAELGTTWDGTVNFYRPQEDPAQIDGSTIGDEPVWVGKFSFTGFI